MQLLQNKLHLGYKKFFIFFDSALAPAFLPSKIKKKKIFFFQICTKKKNLVACSHLHTRACLWHQNMSFHDASQWHQIVDLVAATIRDKHSLVKHHFEGQHKFVFGLLEKICRSETQILKKDGLIYKLEVGKIHVEKPLSYDPETNVSQPKYPYHARWGDSTYSANVKCGFVFKLLKDPKFAASNQDVDNDLASLFGQQEEQTNSADDQTRQLPTVEEAISFTINVGEIMVDVRGDLCRMKGTGMLCHEDSDIEGGYHIYLGSEKVTESQFTQRTNHIYVHFLSSSTSSSQSTTASEATSSQSTTADSPIILQCDYRPSDDDILKTYSAFHIFLVVEKPKYARQFMQKQMQSRKYDSEGHFVSSSTSEPLNKNQLKFLNSPSQIGQDVLGLGENLTVCFPNVDEFNLNLVLVFFLLGLNDRMSMMRCIIPNECHLLESNHFVLADGSLSEECFLAAKTNALLHHAIVIYHQVYVMLHNQSLFVSSDTVDPKRVYYTPSSSVDANIFESTPGTYEHIVANHTPFVGGDFEQGRAGTPSETPNPNFVQQYHEASLDGWDRAAALAHIARLILVKGSQKKKGAAGTNNTSSDDAFFDQAEGEAGADDPKAKPKRKKYVATKYVRDYGSVKQVMPKTRSLPDEAESDRLYKALARFARSFAEELLPQIGTSTHWRVTVAKRTMLGFMIRKMVLVFMGYHPPDSQDDLVMKRCEFPGQMMARVWALSWQKGVSKLFRRIIGQIDTSGGTKRHAINWQSLASSCFPPSPFNGPMENGVWPKGGATVMKVKGCTKRLQYANALTFYESMRCVHTITNEKGGSRMRDSPAQQVDNSHYQKLCPLRTANDKQAGIDLHFTIGSLQRIGYSREELLAIVMQGASEKRTSPFYNHFVRLCDAPHNACAADGGVLQIPPGSVAIFVNGSPVGFTFSPFETMAALRLARRRQFFAMDVAITWVNGPVGKSLKMLKDPFFNYIHVCGDSGALLSPVFDTSQLYKLPAIVMAHTSAVGIFPNFTLAKCALETSQDYDLPYPPNSFNLAHGLLFSALVHEGVIVYMDSEEIMQELVCPSVRDLLPDIESYLDRSQSRDNGVPKQFCLNWDDPNSMARFTCQQNPATRLNQGEKRYSMCVISESFMLGVIAAAIPFVNSDDACRASYAAGMTSQSTGAAPLNLVHKKNIYHMYLVEPKTSLSPARATQPISIVGASNAAIPSITCFYGHGQNGEDGVLRSMAPYGRYNVHHIVSSSSSGKELPSTTAAEESNTTMETAYHFASPKKVNRCLTLKSTDYLALNDDGIPKVGSLLRPGAAVIGRVLAVGGRSNANRDGSVVNSSRMILSVGSVMRGKKKNFKKKWSGHSSLVVRSSAIRVQVCGDKTSSQDGQKGVATVRKRIDVPYTIDRFKRAIIPHKFRPPHGVPSRTTEGEPRAMLHAQVSIARGQNVAVNSWEKELDLFDTLAQVEPNLLDYSLVNPDTGIPLRTTVSIGVLDFRLMRHLARETFNSRSLGAVDPKTEQPTQGTKKRGGSREGPLEALNKISHGVTDVIEQLLFTGSDPGFGHVCVKCGLLASSAAPQVLISHAKNHAMAVPPEEVGRAKYFASRLANSQGGIFHSKDASLPLSPSGGWCSVCGQTDNVYKIPMAKVTRQLVEYGYISGQSWRIITNSKPVKSRAPIIAALPTTSHSTMDIDTHAETNSVLNFDDASLSIPIFVNTMFAPPSPTYSPL